VWLWLAPGSRDVRLATLAVVLLAGNVLAAGKYGAAPNYYLGLRGVEGLAAGALWRAARAAEGRARWAALGAWAALVPMLLLSLGGWAVGIHGVQSQAAFLASPQGRSYLRVHQALLDKARDPAARILTDSGMIDLYQGSRAAFGDPWLFRVMVDTGRIDPVTMKRRIDDGYYDLVVTTSDLDAPKYATFDRALPAVLAERVRKRYEPAGTFGELHFYSRRGERPAPLGTRP
jgi:hypothetical protein